MSSVLLTNSFGTDLAQNPKQSNDSDNDLIIERILAILSENKLKVWFDVGIKDEYQRRFRHKLPANWISILEGLGRDVIEVEVKTLSNVSKTLIQLPLSAIRRQSSSTPPVPTKGANTSRAYEAPVGKPYADLSSGAATPRSVAEPIADIIDLRSGEVSPCASEAPAINLDLSHLTLTANISGIESQPSVETNNSSHKTSNGSSVVSNGHQLIDTNPVPEDVITSGKAIPVPVLPQVKPEPITPEDFFDCIVVLAATPSNFVVVPFLSVNTDSEFTRLKKKMYDMYENDENHVDLPPEVIRPGMFVAGKAKNNWYRIEIRSIISVDPFQVIGYLCDFGEHLTFDLKHIQPLYNVFRGLPAQAIRASLASVQPVGTDWDVMTSVEFRRLVENKPFVSTVYAVTEVDGQQVVSLSLCDTTGQEDVYIGPLLVQRGSAKAKVPDVQSV